MFLLMRVILLDLRFKFYVSKRCHVSEIVQRVTAIMDNQVDSNTITNPGILWEGSCEGYLLFHFETYLGRGSRAFLYFLGLAYCFIGLSSITSRFFRSMENVVKQTREVVEKDPYTNVEIIRHEKVWNFAIADITLLAFGTSFPQISLATIDAIRNIGQLYAGGLYGAFSRFFFTKRRYFYQSSVSQLIASERACCFSYHLFISFFSG